MNYRRYEALYWICRLGSFHAAARQLRTSQAAISIRIRDLERELGVTLFERVHDGVRATPKGKELLPYAAQLVTIAGEVQRIGSATALAGAVRLGATSVHAMTWLPRLLAEIAVETPGIAVDIAIDTSEALETMLDRGRLDIAVLAGPIESPRLATEAVGSIANVWAASPALPLPPGPCAAGTLALHPLISDRPGTRLHAAVLAWFRAEGVEVGRHHSAFHIEARLHLAEAGIGVALVARSAAMPLVGAGTLRLVETERPAPQLDYVLACAAAHLSPAAERVAALVRDRIRRKPDLDAYFAEASC